MGEELSTQYTPFPRNCFLGLLPSTTVVYKLCSGNGRVRDTGVCLDYEERVEMLSKHQVEITNITLHESDSNRRVKGTSSKGMGHGMDRTPDAYI
jgi:hypothetical protein